MFQYMMLPQKGHMFQQANLWETNLLIDFSCKYVIPYFEYNVIPNFIVSVQFILSVLCDCRKLIFRSYEI